MPYFKFENRKVFYRVLGEGDPLLLIHGNSVSSKLFFSIKSIYKKHFKVILFDFPGHGKSERVDKFNTDFWYYNSKVAYKLIEHLSLNNVSVIGTSGGAQVAINLALEHPQIIKFIIADSFEGDFPDETWINGLREERTMDKKKLLAKLFWLFNHGLDWEKVVDLDTEVIINFLKENKSFFHKNISELTVPTLLTGSIEDEFIKNIEERFNSLKSKNPSLSIKLFLKGKHPALLTNKNDFLDTVLQYKNSIAT